MQEGASTLKVPASELLDPVKTPQVALSIAGFDPSSGAGVTADLQVFAAFGLYGTACITSLTVQSTQGVRSTHPVSQWMEFTLAELDLDLPPRGVKIGMLGDVAGVRAAVAYLRTLRNTAVHGVPIVLDPVILASSGARLLTEEALAMLRRELLPLVGWVTPNLAELRELAGLGPETSVEGALAVLQTSCPHLHIVATGGDQRPPEDILLTPNGELHRVEGMHVETSSTHGTGCAFSSALLARLMMDDTPLAAVVAAKHYVTEALRRAPGLGGGRGPLNLLWRLVPRP